MMRIRAVLLMGTIALSPTLIPSAPVQAQTEEARPRRAPQILGARTTNNRVRSRFAKYTITLATPPDARPLEAIQLEQRTGGDAIRLRLEETRVWVNDEEVAIASYSGNGYSEPLRLTFADPIPPDSTITVQLRPRYNPRWSGEYSFGVTVILAEDFTLYLGPARLRFYERDRRIWFP